MYLEKIAIKNFKAIENMTLEFDTGVNVLIGDNGTGKSSILEAIAVALSGALKGMKGVTSRGILQNDIHFSIDESGDASSSVYYSTPTEIVADLKYGENSFHWKRFRLDEDGKSITKQEDDGIAKWMQSLANDQDAVLPLFCFQSDARVQQVRRVDFGKNIKKELNDRRCGYIGCMDYSMDVKTIQSWCLKMELSAFQKKKTIGEYEVFKRIVANFMQTISGLEKAPELHYSSQLNQLVYEENEELMPIANLSAGYQSLLWMIMNLAYRLALLNPDKTKKIDEIPGIILIDEIDMHLHPKWQWNIVSALEETFPKMQIILATHSPIVISSCKNEKLILIDNNQEVLYLENAYGYSVQDVLNFRQGTTEKPEQIKKISDPFDKAIEEDDFEEAQKQINQMEELLGTEHADVRAAKEELQLNRW